MPLPEPDPTLRSKSRNDEPPEALPAIVRAFIRATHAGIPSGYSIGASGISQTSPKLRLCSPLRVAAESRSSAGTDWSLLIEVLTPDLTINEILLPRELLESKPRDAIARLSAIGLRLYVDHTALVRLLRNWTSDRRVTMVDRIGWTPSFAGFVLPDGTALSAPNSRNVVRYSGTRAASVAGSLEGWRTGVSALCLGNPYLVFAVSLAFSGPLLNRLAVAPAVFHLHGPTSIGKTKLLAAATSVWRGYDRASTWRTTDNGLEGRLRVTNDGFLALDELTTEAHAGFASDIYMIANGTGRQRATVTGAAQESASWSVAVLSCGEVAALEVLRASGKTVRGGQTVRLVDLEIQRNEYGVFSDLHGAPDSASFARRIETAVRRDGGHAGRAFVEMLLTKYGSDDDYGLEAAMSDASAQLRSALDITPGAVSGEVSRVLDAFSLVAAAGELASPVTGWPSGHAMQAVAKIAAQWLATRGVTPADQREAIIRTRNYCQQNEATRFRPFGTDDDAGVDLAGWMDEECYYLTAAALAEAHPVSDPKRIAQLLLEAGFLKPGGEQGSLQYRLPRGSATRPRVYRISREIMSFC